MRVLAILFFLCLTPAAAAQTVQVTSGEHKDFSRLVLTFPTAVDWQLGRSAEGYALRVSDSRPLYDLSDVYRRLSRDRLSDIHAENGALFLQTGCDCHAMPFELAPGQLVIDIRTGPAPAGSSFELPLAPETGTVVTHQDGPQHVSGMPMQIAETNWSDAVRNASRLPKHPVRLPEQNPERSRDLDTIRSALLWQLSKGATGGLVELVPGGKAGADIPSSDHPDQVRIGDSPAVTTHTPDSNPDLVLANGNTCFDGGILAVESWGQEGPVASELGHTMSGLIGEFDLPDDAAIAQASRYLLYLGFGAEVSQMLNAFQVTSGEANVWRAMAQIMDLEPDQTGVFAGMEACKTAAALWAVLAQPELPVGQEPEVPAILRAFSALPLHLRRHLGPPLADRFLNRDDIPTSRAIKDAIMRAGENHDASVELLAEKLQVTTNSAENLEQISTTSGPAGIDATIELARLQATSGGEVPVKVISALEAFYHEARGGESAFKLQKALASSYASQNRFSEAFTLFPPTTANAADIWIRLAEFGSDEALITNAILPDGFIPIALPPPAEQKIAERLIDIGFPAESLLWLGESRRKSGLLSEADKLLHAKAAASLGNDTLALRFLAGISTPDAELQRARALTNLGNNEAGASFAKTQASAEWQQSAKQRQAWAELASLDLSRAWGAAVRLGNVVLAPSDGSDTTDGPIARSRMALDESSEARAVLQNLLGETAVDPIAR